VVGAGPAGDPAGGESMTVARESQPSQVRSP
jgi:hypothetical protein